MYIYVYLVTMMEASPIFTKTLELLRIGTRNIVEQGGQWSGKTVNILGALTTLCAEEVPGNSDNPTTTVTGQSFPHLKGGALRDFEDFVYPHFKGEIKQYHKTDHIFTFKSGSRLEFKVFETEMKARGAKRKRLFVNEANSFDWMIFFQLNSRAQQSIIDYNPSVRFWAHEKLIGEPNTEVIYSDHRHNPFLTKEKHAEIEAYYNFETGKGDLELFKVYSRGITGNVTGVIFPNWEMIDEDDFPANDALEWVFCVDFGYTNDPTALMKVALVGNTLFVKELAYETGLPAINIIQIARAHGFKPEISPLYCEHDPDMIRDLRHHGAPYADFARKGQGSINAGIELLKRYDVKYPSSSRNLHRERGMYVWEKDKKTGDETNIPVDNNNHTFDAIRYGAYTRYLRTT